LGELEEFPCHCPTCCEYVPKEVLKFDEKVRTELIAKHNLYLSFSELRTIRQAIKEGNLWELVEQRIRNHPTLAQASKIIKNYLPLFEKHEKLYKTHGRLYSSLESTQRPLIYRHESKIISNFRVPEDAKYLILLPELDVKGDQSDHIKEILEKINNNSLIPRNLIHIAYLSDFYGVVPLELSATFPLGQYESIELSGGNNLIYENFINKVEIYFKNYSRNYSKCGILLPERYTNQFGEEVLFSRKNIIMDLAEKLRTIYKIKISLFTEIETLIKFLSD
jgi:7-cyano-7-deazaguanine tRNA-ribosyltransferase